MLQLQTADPVAAPKRRLHPEDARNILGFAEENAADTTPENLIAAGVSLVTEVERLEGELARARARLQMTTSQAARVAGARLELGEDGGGRRHFLAGRPVQSGTGLYLLTAIGWMPGRYEWGFDQRRPRFYFEIPGAGDEESVPIASRAHLAWPAEFTRPRS